MTDFDGHGTQVASIILRLAPRAELYIARVCAGDIYRGVAVDDQAPGIVATRNEPKVPLSEEVAAAIDWAVEQGVDLINMSFGWTHSQKAVRGALERAKERNIIVLASMSNEGNNSPDNSTWPAREARLAIGVHSCQEGGTKSSYFTPLPEKNLDNFMVIGENVLTDWPESKGGGMLLADGTSFATPVVTAMAAMILEFVWQTSCNEERDAIKMNLKRAGVSLDEILKNEGMAKVLSKISKPGETKKYS